MPIKRMNVQEWRAQRKRTEMPLPESDLTVTLRKVSLLSLAANGQIPQTLAAAADQLLSDKGADISLAELRSSAEVINLVVKACVIDPPLVDTEEEATQNPDAVWIGELAFEDRIAIFQWANAKAQVQALKPFRPEPAGAVGPLQLGEPVRPAAERDLEGQGSVGGLPAGFSGAEDGAGDRSSAAEG